MIRSYTKLSFAVLTLNISRWSQAKAPQSMCKYEGDNLPFSYTECFVLSAVLRAQKYN